ncbi:hypothetical protein GCM10010124_30960 [Pilimelia terevasa]|uniref:Putative zinc-finger domain-containing protein n=1 Tax=Pilimelia terevasa TaxID=53372 RepID=A0A8J3BP90_9ACTN|nr:zf-HC2 domain-containing protein [Pilimelia terevasa]GGK36105.1 hypothetical protein GCM10010124_30960 [Pilimelia terevasa]
MTITPHHNPLLGAYALDALDQSERTEADAHLAGCADCRAELTELTAVRAALGHLPPEALLHGPPDADLVLHRTLRQVRKENTARQRWGLSAAAAATVAALAGAVLAGAALTSRSAPPPTAAPPTTTAEPQPPGTRIATTQDPRTHVRVTASIIPVANWVRINVAVNGIAQGQDCRLIVVDRQGRRMIAGGWIVSEKGERDGTNLDGTAAIAVGQVSAVEVENTAGTRLVSLRV